MHKVGIQELPDAVDEDALAAALSGAHQHCLTLTRHGASMVRHGACTPAPRDTRAPPQSCAQGVGQRLPTCKCKHTHCGRLGGVDQGAGGIPHAACMGLAGAHHCNEYFMVSSSPAHNTLAWCSSSREHEPCELRWKEKPRNTFKVFSTPVAPHAGLNVTWQQRFAWGCLIHN